MKSLELAVSSFLIVASIGANAAPPVINISVGGEISPGVYGQVEFGNSAPPPLLYAEPKIILRDRRAHEREPIYLHVPPGHARKWAKHCREYDACDREVYFVKSAEYDPGYRRHKGHDHDNHQYRDDRGSDDRGRDENDRRGTDRGDRDSRD